MRDFTGRFSNPIFSIRLVLIFVLIVTVAANSFAQTEKTNSNAKSYQFINGNWFDGKTFKSKVFYAVGGVFSNKKPKKIDETVDLKNGYVVPPFADAHTHHFDSTYVLDGQIRMYLTDGVFYAKVQTDVRTGAMQTMKKLNRPDSVDVSFAHGALTHTDGHGIEIYEALALNLYFDRKVYDANIEKIRASRLRENDAYYIIDTLADLENKWQKILDGKPDFIKIYLMTSEDFEKKRDNPGSFSLGGIGLDPQIVPAIVKKAHAAGLRVSAHVDTVTDYRIALDAGVDEMAHLPGYYVQPDDKLEKYLLTEADAKKSARQNLWIVPAPVAYGGIEPQIRARTDEGLKHNLGLLKKYKVNIAFGSDSYGRTSVADVLYLNQIKIFSNLEALKIWTEETPKTIFPNRKIGKLQNGYEASFLVLSGDPLKDFAQVKNINLRFKQGTVINVK